MKEQFNEDGLNELRIEIIKMAKEDYIKGALVLIRKFKRPMDMILEHETARDIILKARPGAKDATTRRIYWYKDAKRFVEEDPYEMFADPEIVIKTWNKMAWNKYKGKSA